MLRNYKLAQTRIEPIPNTDYKYFASLECEVFDVSGNLLQPDEDGNVEVFISGLSVKRSPNWFACYTFKTPVMELEDILKCDVRVIEKGSKESENWIYNVGWKFPVGGIECKTYPGFNYIPGATKYIVNREGEVINWFTSTAKKAKSAANIYLTMRVVDDAGHSCARMLHRLVGLAWLDYPMDNHNYEINHIDGNQANNKIENLEWVTRAGNMEHYVKNQGRSYQVRDVETGSVVEFKTQSAICTYIGVTKNEIGNMVRAGEAYAFRNKWQIREKTDKPWFESPELVWGRGQIQDESEERFECYDYLNDTIKIIHGRKSLIEFTGIIPKVIDQMLESSCLMVVKGFSIRRVGDPRNFPKLTGDGLEVALKYDGIRRVVKVEQPSVKYKQYFSNLNQACLEFGLKFSTVNSSLKMNPSFYTNGVIVSYI